MRAFNLAGLALLFAGSLAAQKPDSAGAHSALVWGPAPPVFSPGAKMAVVSGNPAAAGPFTIQLSMPDGYKVMPHTHPTDEKLTVKKGAFLVGMGASFDASKANALATGATATAPAKMAHYAQAKGATIVEVTSVGPFAMTYVNPADDPSRKSAP
jgi:hypothetical protein